MILKFEDYKKAKVISAFPGCGKSHFYRSMKDEIKILDSDSSKFDKSDFPRNYIEHIKENIPSADIILVSSHEDVRKELAKNGIDFTLVFPDISLKEQYIKRYKERGSPESFIKLLDNNWDNWINQLLKQESCDKIILKKDQYLADVIKNI
jgi:hypothetical protein